MPSTNFELVSDFQRKVLGNEKPPLPRLPPDARHEINCLLEEVEELQAAFDNGSAVDAADALADLVYFALGCAFKMGIPFDEVFRIVHLANLAKRKGITKRGHADDAAKPEGWIDPRINIRKLLHGSPRT